MKIEIDRAMALYTLKTGKSMTRRLLAQQVLPDMRDSSSQVIIRKMAEGQSKRPDPVLVKKIAEVLQVDMNYLYNWKEK